MNDSWFEHGIHNFQSTFDHFECRINSHLNTRSAVGFTCSWDLSAARIKSGLGVGCSSLILKIDLIWFDLIWFDLIWYLIWFDLIWFDLIWFDLIWFDLILTIPCRHARVTISIRKFEWKTIETNHSVESAISSGESCWIKDNLNQFSSNYVRMHPMVARPLGGVTATEFIIWNTEFIILNLKKCTLTWIAATAPE